MVFFKKQNLSALAGPV